MDLSFFSGNDMAIDERAQEDRKVIVSDDYKIYIGDDEQMQNRSFKIKFGSPTSVEHLFRRPMSLVQGLAKIGGFLGFLKIFSLFL